MKHFEPTGYVHVNQDNLKSRDKCVRRVEQVLREKKSCVVGKPPPLEYLVAQLPTALFISRSDNTNRDQATRKHYIDLARQFRVPIR